jgi:uncharacterized circularly permuted ATP-grasp superfamily protein/uncharacterized alpha-E superfamily protein
VPTPAPDLPDPLARLLAEYAVPPGVADELLDADGRMRPVWAPFLRLVAGESAEGLARRFARGDQYLGDAGVFFRQYSGPQPERAWPLSHIPVLLAEAEWQTITAALAERADLLEAVMADLYGPGKLVEAGLLPAELVAGNPHWLRPLVGVAPASGHFLHLLAFEIGRNPDGTWFVLGDRTQAPSGAGFALENRMATARAFPDPGLRRHVRRLAGYFRAFGQHVEGLARAGGGGAAILTPGVNTDTYFEHAYIARYLGMMLLEGEDLTVRDGQVLVRTVSGLRPLSVLWRRLDSEWADPLELRESSQIGTPGLVSALRDGGLTLMNALGAGVLETRALLAFLPKISEALHDRPLAMPSIATWWCGQESERAYVEAEAGRMMIGPALSTALPFDTADGTGPGDRWATPATRAARLAAEGARLVGQEAVSLSTTPVHDGTRLVPRPMTVRVFAARTPGGWVFMPGGYARIGRSGDATALAMQRGGSVADVWIMAEAEVAEDSILDAAPLSRQRDVLVLPSRAADNLYWLGRYVERTEGAVRLTRAYHLRLAETGDRDERRVALLGEAMWAVGLSPAEPVPQGLIAQVEAARSCAGKVRDRFSPDGWAALRELSQTAARLAPQTDPGDDAARKMGLLLRTLAGFSGLVQDNMYRFTGWRFLRLGRALERALGTAQFLAALTAPGQPMGALDAAIELGDSVLTHQRRYRAEPRRETVLDLLALDGKNPRSILFQLGVLAEVVADLPDPGEPARRTPITHKLLRLRTDLEVATPGELTPDRLRGIAAELQALHDLVGKAYF